MIKYTSLGNYEIKGKGTVYMVVNQTQMKFGKSGLIGKKVSINGIVYKVKGVETNATPIVKVGDTIGILV